MTVLTVNMTPLATGGPLPPDAPAAPALAVSGNVVTVTLSPNPADNGSPIHARGLRYRPAGGAWVEMYGVTDVNDLQPVTIAPAGNAALPHDTVIEVQTRAANGEGPGPWSPSASIATETDQTPYVAPTLTGAQATASGSSGFSGSVTTSKGGTLYVLTTQTASETTAGIVAGGSPRVVGQAGLASFGEIGVLAPETTYYTHLAFTDGTNTVTATAGPFTTAAQGTGSGAVSISLAKMMQTPVAPAYVHLDVSVTGASVSSPGNRAAYDPTHNELAIVTTFGDPGAASDKVTNLPAVWNDLDVAHGKHPAHVYTAPGTYTITTRVYELDGAFVGEDTIQVQVQDPDVVFAGNRTALVSAAAAGDPAYPGAATFGTIPQAVAWLQGLNQTGRILLKAGETFETNSQTTLTSAFDNVYIGTYGTGRATWRIAASNSITPGGSSPPGFLIYLPGSFDKDAVFRGIDFVGRWNSADLSGQSYRCISFDQSAARRIVVDDCTFDGWASAVEPRGGSGDIAYCVHNCDITNWQDYGTFVGDNGTLYLAYIGCAIHQDRNAEMNGAQSKNWRNNHHGPMRIGSCETAYVACNDMFSRNGWTGAGGNPASQPCIRSVSGSESPFARRPHMTYERNALEGGFCCFATANQRNGVNYWSPTTLIDKMLVVGTANTYSPIFIDHAGTTVRNVLGWMPNVPRLGLEFQGWFDHANNVGVYGQDTTAPVRLSQCTFVNFLDDARRGGSGLPAADGGFGGAFSDYALQDVAVWNPNASVAAGATDIAVSTTPLATVGGTWSSRFDGKKVFPGTPVMDASYASPAHFVGDGTPLGGSPLLGDATGHTARDDAYGQVRGPVPDRGAVEA